MPLLDVRDLHVALHHTEIIRGVSFQLQPGETLGIVGESGCGKSLTALALLRLLPSGGKITGGQILLNGTDLTQLSEKEMRKVRGKDIAIIFQDPFTSLNPVMRVGDQIAEALVFHRNMSWKEARKEAIKRLAEVKVPAPESTARKFPHQLSGGQRQRVMSAIAFACHPKVLIADEPTTALDVTLQSQILALLKELQQQEGTGVILISHDIGVVGTMADYIAVYYAGKIVEFGSTPDVLLRPAHPYTQALLASLPRPTPNDSEPKRLPSIPGQPPNFHQLPQGCSFAPRCAHRHSKCENEPSLFPVPSLPSPVPQPPKPRREPPPFVDLAATQPSPAILSILPRESAIKYRAIPIKLLNNVLVVAMDDPENERLVKEVALSAGCRVLPQKADPQAITRALQTYYQAEETPEPPPPKEEKKPAPSPGIPHQSACWLVSPESEESQKESIPTPQ